MRIVNLVSDLWRNQPYHNKDKRWGCGCLDPDSEVRREAMA